MEKRNTQSQLTGHLSSSSSCNVSPDPYPFASLKEQKTCRLQITLDGFPVDAAYGIVLQSGPTSLINFKRLPPFYARVILRYIIDEFDTAFLPMDIDGKVTLSDGKGAIIPWPAGFIVITDEVPDEMGRRLENRDVQVNQSLVVAQENTQVAESNQTSTGKKPMREITDDMRKKFMCTPSVIKSLGKYEKMLYDMLLEKGNHTTSVTMRLAPWVFQYDEQRTTLIDFVDIKEMLCRDMLNISIIQVYCMYLMAKLRYKKLGAMLTFLCPESLSLDVVNRDSTTFQHYVTHCIKKAVDKGSKYLMMPFHQINHWLLLMHSVDTSQLLLLDPLRMYRELHVDELIKTAVSDTVLEQFNRFSVVHLECPRQNDSRSCGFFVLRYMYEICTHIEELTKDDKVRAYFKNAGKTYSPKDLQLIREQTSLFILKCFKDPEQGQTSEAAVRTTT